MHRRERIDKFSYSMMSCFMNCEKKFYWKYIREIVPRAFVEKASGALVFGKAIHAALDEWYKSKDEEKAYAVFEREWNEEVRDEKRNRENGKKVLRTYFKQYRDAPVELIESEARFEFSLALEKLERVVIIRGIVDKIVRFAGVKCAMDHKTTSSLSGNSFNMAEPNLQFQLYSVAVDCEAFIVDFLLVCKTRWDNARNMFYVSDEQKKRALETARMIILRILDHVEDGEEYLMNMDACTNFNSSCPYRRLCIETDERVVESIIKQEYVIEERDKKEEVEDVSGN